MTYQMPPKQVTITVDMPEPKPFDLDPATSLLVVVDMENAFCTPGYQHYGERMETPIAGNVSLLKSFREAGAPVIFIQSVRKEDNLEVVRFGCTPHLLEGTPDVEIVEAIKPLPGEPVVQKWGHDPFARTTLDSLLDSIGADPKTWTVLVTGVSAAVCAHACALGFANRHFLTVIPMDATAAGTLEEEARTFLQYMGPGYDYCMDFTTSDLVSFTAPVTAQPELVTA